MDYKIILCLMLLSYSVLAFPKNNKQTNEHIDEQIYEHTYEQIDKQIKEHIDDQIDEQIGNYQDNDDDDQEIEYESTLADEEFKTNAITEKPRSQYEVTEIVIDIPDNRTKGPIVTNYTIYRPLNTVLNTDKETIENIIDTGCREHNKKTTVTLNESGAEKKNSITIFHVKAEFEDKTEKVTPQVVNFYNVSPLSRIKDYIIGIKQGIVNGFNSIIHKRKREDDGFEMTGPLAFLTNLHKKNGDTAHDSHDVLFGHTIDEHF